jgi:hypothetical protein
VWLCPARRCTNQIVTDGLCVDCYCYLHVLLTELPVLWRQTRTMLAKQTQVAEKVDTSPTGSTPPLRLGILDVTETVLGIMVTWVATLKLRNRDQLAVTVESDAELFAHASDYLLSFYITLVGSPLLVDFYNSIYDAHGKLNRIAGDNPELRRLTDPCPTCGMIALIMRGHDDYVRCLTCSSSWGQSAYQGLRRRSSLPRRVDRCVS